MEFKRPKISKKKIVIFSVFVFMATIFWFLNALNKEYITKIEYPIKFNNIPENTSIISEVPKNIVISVKAYGYDIISKLNIKEPIIINVKKLSEKTRTSNPNLIISTSKIKDALFPNISNIEIIRINPEKIILKTSTVSSKKIPVLLNVTYSTKTLYMLSGKIKLIPDSIIVSGPEKLLLKTQFIETKNTNFKNIEDTIKENVKLKEIKGLNFSKKEIKIILPIDKYTEDEIQVPVNIINCPDSLKLVTFPDKVKITYKIILNKYKTIGENNFTVVADFLDIKNSSNNKIKIQLTKQAKNIQSVKISPEYLEYIIEKSE